MNREEQDTNSVRVTVVITTRNRVRDLVHAIRSCLIQDEPCEVIVFDDASTDETHRVVTTQFPRVRLIQSDVQMGYIVHRNRGFHEATSEFVVSIDDDASFSDSRILTDVVRTFDQIPEAAALALPYVEPLSGRDTMSSVSPGTDLRGFVGCSHALRRQVVLDLGGYPEFLLHQGEERDLAIRILDHGMRIPLCDTLPIVHTYSPQRDLNRISFYGYRNTVLFSWMRLPSPECFIRASIDTAQLLRYKFSFRSLGPSLWALAAGWWGGLRYWHERKPVRRETWRLYCSLPRHGPLSLTETQRAEYQKWIDERLLATQNDGT